MRAALSAFVLASRETKAKQHIALNSESIHYALRFANLCIADEVLEQWLRKNKCMFVCNKDKT